MKNSIKNKMYLKVPYSILDCGWRSEPKTFVLLLHLMLLANRKPHEYMGDVIDSGEVLASYEFLANHTGLSIQNVRTAIKHLKATNMIKQRKIHKTNVFTIVSFKEHQSLGIPTDNEKTQTQSDANNAVQPFEGNG